MSSPTTGLRVAGVVFGIFAIGHIIRLVGHIQVTVGATQIPIWVSWVAVVVAGCLSIWFWRLSARG
jgi:hypothetical protein